MGGIVFKYRGQQQKLWATDYQFRGNLSLASVPIFISNTSLTSLSWSDSLLRSCYWWTPWFSVCSMSGVSSIKTRLSRSGLEHSLRWIWHRCSFSDVKAYSYLYLTKSIICMKFIGSKIIFLWWNIGRNKCHGRNENASIPLI